MPDPLDIPEELRHLIEKRSGEDRRDPNRKGEQSRDAAGNPIERRSEKDRRSNTTDDDEQ